MVLFIVSPREGLHLLLVLRGYLNEGCLQHLLVDDVEVGELARGGGTNTLLGAGGLLLLGAEIARGEA